MTDTTSAAPSERKECRAAYEAWAKSLDLAHDARDPAAMWIWASWQAAWNRRAQPTPLAVVEPRMPVDNATLERLREWERDGELLERVWGTLVDQETEIGLLRAALVIAVDHIDMAALRISHCQDASAIEVAHGVKGDSHGLPT